MITVFYFFFMLILQADTIYSDCPLVELCHCETLQNEIICDGNFGNQSDDMFPSVEDLPPVENYVFSNFKQIQAHAFENMTFLDNHSITINLTNITIIDTEAFSASMIIPENSTISIYIENSPDIPSIKLNIHSFNNIKIDRLYFLNINGFNGESIFDTHCFGSSLYLNELIFEQCNITGFANSGRRPANIQNLSIRDCPTLTQLNDQILPTFLETTKTLEISTTGLQFINYRTFQAWSIVLRELIIKNNINLRIFSSDIVVGVLMDLNKLDLSNNSIMILDQNYNWFPYSYTKSLILKQQQQLELFLQSNILKTLGRLKTIDFSEGFISDNNEDIIKNYVPGMPNLALINISYTNFTENMVIDLLTRISQSANQTVQVSLLGHTLNDTYFCSYFKVFQQAPNVLQLELDETHECNCVVDLFYDEQNMRRVLNDGLIQPSCLLNLDRPHCDIQSQLVLSKCSVGNANSDDSNNGDIGSYAFIGIMVGLTVVLIALLALGSSVIYRARQGRRMTILNMEDPVDPSSSITVEQPIENCLVEYMEEPLESAS